MKHNVQNLEVGCHYQFEYDGKTFYCKYMRTQSECSCDNAVTMILKWGMTGVAKQIEDRTKER